MLAEPYSQPSRQCTTYSLQVKHFFEENAVPNNVRKVSQMLESMKINVRFFKSITASQLSTSAFWDSIEV